MIKSDSPNFPLFYILYLYLIHIFALTFSLSKFRKYNECSAFQFFPYGNHLTNYSIVWIIATQGCFTTSLHEYVLK